MKIIKLKGGLGNQMFQYSFMRHLQMKLPNECIRLDCTQFDNTKNDSIRQLRLKMLNVKFDAASSEDLHSHLIFKHNSNPRSLVYKSKIWFEKSINKSYYFEKNRAYINPDTIIDYSYFDGYWQSWRYLMNIETELRNDFKYKQAFCESSNLILSKIRSENAVFVGIRRGDYLSTKSTRDHYGTFSQDYFDKAMDIIKNAVEDPILYVFSNDIEWVKENIDFDLPVVYRGRDENVSDVEELFLMSACKHAVIVNSTFYWWGSWLIENADKIIIAPKNWFADGAPIDIVPDSWIKI